MLNIKRKLSPVQRKPRSMKTITKKIRRKPVLTAATVADKGWASSHIDQSYTSNL